MAWEQESSQIKKLRQYRIIKFVTFGVYLLWVDTILSHTRPSAFRSHPQNAELSQRTIQKKSMADFEEVNLQS